MVLKLTYIGETSLPVEVEGLLPEWACDKSLAEIERFEIFHGSRRLALAELFQISGNATDRQFEFVGNLSGVHWVGAQMKEGTIRIDGSVGRHLGSEMRGGQIHVAGDSSDWTGAEMHGGLIHVRGRAGHLLGAAYRGSLKGMTGGTLLVAGDAGDEVGLAMRRGLIAVAGDCGNMLGFNIIAGTILAFGNCGRRPGAGMRRGTIGLLGPAAPPLLSSFRYDGTLRPVVMDVVLRHVRSKGLAFDETLMAGDFDFFRGDLVSVGRGEVVVRGRPLRRTASEPKAIFAGQT